MPEARAVSAMLAVTDIDQNGKQWIEVLPTADAVKNGPFHFTVTAQDLDTYAQSIRDNAGKIPVDYDHSGDKDRGTRAAGWFTGQTRVDQDPQRGPILNAEVQWTPKAAQEIKDGEYRMVSAVPGFLQKDRKSGLMTGAKAIVAATLTNRPFFKQLAALASDFDDDQLATLAEKLGIDVDDLVTLAVWSTAEVNDLPDTAFLYIKPGGAKDTDDKTTPRDLRMFPFKDSSGKVDLPHLRNALARIPQSGISDADKQKIEKKARQILSSNEMSSSSDGGKASAGKEGPMSDELKVLAASFGLPEDATADQITAAREAEKTKADADAKELAELKATASASKTDLEKLREDLDQERTLRLTNERDSFLAASVDEGRIDPAQKSVLAERFGDDLEGLKAVVASFPKRSRTERGTSGAGSTTGIPEPELEAVASNFEYASGSGKNARVVTAAEGELELHIRAEKILAEQGKHPGSYTPEEYVAALNQAERTPLVAA